MLSKGHAYERIAQEYLHKQGLQSLACNYRSKFGEIDLVMRDNNTLVFIEVRFRSLSSYGQAAETVTRKKQKKIVKTASLFLSQRKLWDKPCRFDVVSIDKLSAEAGNQIHWYKAAFDAA